MLLGFVPKQIQRVVGQTSNKSLGSGSLPVAARKVLATQLLQQWNKVQQLMIAKAVGLHRLLNIFCKQRGKIWKAEFKE